MTWKGRLVTPLVGLALTPMLAQAGALEQVVVTAQKREQSLQDVGIAVTALNGQQIQKLGFSNAQEVTALAPGVSTIQPNGPSNYAIAIRGVAQNDFVSNQESPVSVYIDEVYVSQMSAAGFLLFDMERVEILRGPQGTLFGRNATGGLAHYVTRKPTEAFEGYAQVTGGAYDQVKLEGAVSGALGDGIMGRVSIATHHNSGYVENRLLGKDINNANDYAGRGQLLITPNEDLELLLNLRGSLQQIRTGFFENVSAADLNGDHRGELTPGRPNLNGYRDDDGDVFAGDYDRFGFQDAWSVGGSSTIKWQVADNLRVTSITDFQKVVRDYLEDSDASPSADFNFYLTTDAEQRSQEFRIDGEMARVRWTTGFYFLNIKVEDANGAEQPLLGVFSDLGLSGPLIDSPAGEIGALENDGSFLGNDNPYTTETTSWSLFGQFEYDLSEQFSTILGVRYINEDKAHQYANHFVDYNNDGTTKRGGNPNIIEVVGTYSGEYNEGLWSAKAELDWRPNVDWLIYASWNRGVKGGGFNAPLDITGLTLNDDLMAFDEEVLDAFEIGFKASLFDGRARVNGAAFYYDYQDFQAFRIEGLSTFIFNADSKNKGFELEIQSSPIEDLDVLFGMGFVDIDLPVDLGLGLGPRNTRPVQSPKWNLNGLARYAWPMPGGRMAIQGDFQYRSELFFSLTQAEAVTEDGYTLTNARLSYTTDNDRWTAALFVHNLTNEQYLVQTFDLATVLGMTEQYYGLPRWFGGSVHYRF